MDLDLPKGTLVRVRPTDNPLVSNHHKLPGFRGVLVRAYKDHRGREVAEVREDNSQGLYSVLADRVSPIGRKRLAPIAYAKDYDGPRVRRSPTPRDPNAPPRAPRPGVEPKPCTCGCGGTTGGGNFLPGHDARLVSMVLNKKAKVAALEPFPKLMAKYLAKKGK